MEIINKKNQRNVTSTEKYSVVIKQTVRGLYYLGSLRINADTLEEMKNSIDTALAMITKKIENLNARKNKTNTQDTKQEISLNSEENKLFENLRHLRTELAIKENIPAYMIFHDFVLKLLAKQRPKTKEEMLAIPCIADKKFEQYGEIFLKKVKDFEGVN